MLLETKKTILEVADGKQENILAFKQTPVFHTVLWLLKYFRACINLYPVSKAEPDLIQSFEEFEDRHGRTHRQQRPD